MITFDSDFEGGSLDRAIKMGENWYHLALRPDTWYFFCCRIRGCKGKNIVFEISCSDNCDPAYKNGRNRWLLGSHLHRPVVSYDDRKTWEYIERTEKNTEMGEGTYRFSHTFTNDEAYITYAPQYLYSDLNSWIQTIEGDPLVKTEIIGKSRNGIPQPLLTITANEKNRNLILLICREDADEFVANWSLEGIVRYLLKNKPKKLLEQYTFKIVPMVNVDGVLAGTPYGAGCDCLTTPGWGMYGTGSEQFALPPWKDNSSPQEIENLKQAINHWVNDEKYNLVTAGKLHSAQYFMDPGMTGLDPKIRLSSKNGKKIYGDAHTADPLLRDFLFNTVSDYWNPIYVGLRLESGGDNFEMYLANKFNFLSSFAIHFMGEDAESARKSGEGLLKAIIAYIEHKEK